MQQKNRKSCDLSKYVSGKWIQGDLEDNCVGLFPQSDYSAFKGLTNVEVFEKCMSPNILEFLVEQIRLYSQFKNCPDPNISQENIQCFIAILVLSGYNEVPGKRYYWNSGKDMRNEAVFNAMRRDRFTQIM